MSEACAASRRYHGRGNSTYLTCREHIECEACLQESLDNVAFVNEQDAYKQKICAQYGVECNPTNNTTKHTECESYCEIVGPEDRKDCMNVCLPDSNAIHLYLEEIVLRKEREWQTYRKEIKKSTNRILSKMQNASPRARERLRKHLDTFPLD